MAKRCNSSKWTSRLHVAYGIWIDAFDMLGLVIFWVGFGSGISVWFVFLCCPLAHHINKCMVVKNMNTDILKCSLYQWSFNAVESGISVFYQYISIYTEARVFFPWYINEYQYQARYAINKGFVHLQGFTIVSINIPIYIIYQYANMYISQSVELAH